MGRHAEVLAQIRKAEEVDPLSLIVNAVEVDLLYMARQYDDAIAKMNDNELARVRRRFGMLFQTGALLNSLSVGENVALPVLETSRVNESIADTVVKLKLELVGLTGFEHLKPAQISGGMKKRAGLARAIALCSYKSAELFSERFARRPDRSGEDPQSSINARYDIAGYLDYQGSIFTSRFDANSYLVLSKAMDTFDLAHGNGSATSLEAALCRIRARLLLIGISSDWLFPASDVRALFWAARAHGVKASYAELNSSHGHDTFLAEAAQLTPIINALLEDEQRALARAGRR